MEKSINYQLDMFDIPGHGYKVQIKINEPNQNGKILSMRAWTPGNYVIRDFSRNMEAILAYSEDVALTTKKINNHSWILDYFYK
ncbi:hypothetical protein [Candidatus Kinetoplastidibacterium blastocrithidiae]|uniref:M61 family metallopeptidase n=1 Tax=Candidatus Kinetoplastidibacterium blastocrithidiae TaxID=233181 RepID=UPI0002A664A2|nr:hypothetical protein [Candidatus Kinetoplastibacterium blastocrithidii]AFZ83402.1 hypothetical protein CKBE_00213 [Candidatus Kinetoplastibacterium blastocrithidii (ex Strigomonas culicis)]